MFAENTVYVRSAGAWRILWRDTGWVAISLSGSGFTGSLQYRASATAVVMIGDLSGTFTTGAPLVISAGAVPAGLVPPGTAPAIGACHLGSGYVGAAELNSSGRLRILQQTGAARATANFTVAYAPA